MNNLLNIEEEKYQHTINTIKKYILYVRKYDGSVLNNNIPNYHIAETFKKYLIALDYENRFTYEYGNVKIIHNNITSIGDNNPELYDKLEDGTYTITKIKNMKILEYMDDYFNNIRLNDDGINEISKTYNKLCEKKDIVRNTVKLQYIELPTEFHHRPNSKYFKLKTNSI